MSEPARGLGTPSASAAETRGKQRKATREDARLHPEEDAAAGDAAPEPGRNTRTPERRGAHSTCRDTSELQGKPERKHLATRERASGQELVRGGRAGGGGQGKGG